MMVSVIVSLSQLSKEKAGLFVTMGRNVSDHGIAEQNVAIDSTYIPDLNDKALERRVVRKIDMHILPFICISYLINYLDRV